MKKKTFQLFVLISALPLFAGFALASEEASPQETTQTQMQEQIYGSQLMTPQERDEYRARMFAAESDEEREQIRAEHHQRMQERAKEAGVKLPDEPPVRRGGIGPGGGMGMGRERGNTPGGGKGR